MKRNVRWSLRISWLAMVATIGLAGPAQAQLSVVPPVVIPSLGGTCNVPSDINDQGVVVGAACLESGVRHAYRWTEAGGLVDLHTEGLSGDHSQAQRINASGQIAGEVSVGSNRRVFLWSNGSLVDLGPVLSNTIDAQVHALHDNGTITGYYYDGTVANAFVWSPGSGFRDLNPPGAVSSVGRDVNAAGSVVGTFHDSNLRKHAFVFRNGTFWDVTPDAAGCVVESEGLEIDDTGRVAGSYRTSCEPTPTVFTWLDGSIELLTGANSLNPVTGLSGRAMNEAGLLVGFGGPTPDEAVAWSRRPGEAVTPLIPAGAINEAGRFLPSVVSEDGVVGGYSGVYFPYFWSAQSGMVPAGGRGYAASISSAGAAGPSLETGLGLYWRFRRVPTVTVTVASVIGAVSTSGAPVTFTVTASAGAPECTVGGQPFSSGGVLTLGEHTIVCTATHPVDLLTGQGSATTTVIYVNGGGSGGGTGSQGPAGPQGIQGVAGPQGEKGDKGDKGDRGDQGEKGEKGEKGDKGDKGDSGDQGEKGDKGDQGEKGDRGEAGVAGPTGGAGAAGPQGATGPQGPIGPQGPAGPQGATGFQGPAGVPGVAGPGVSFVIARVTETAAIVMPDNGKSVIYLVTPGRRNATITLPPAASAAGRFVIIKRQDRGRLVFVRPSGTDSIEASRAMLRMESERDSLTFVTDGTEWVLLSRID